MISIVITVISCIILEHVSRVAFSEFVTFGFNYGAAFGIFDTRPGVALLLSVIACGWILLVLIFTDLTYTAKIGLAIMLGGALSNLLEKIFLGYVIDWIYFPFLPDLKFNVADIEISTGALLTLIACIT